MSILSPASVFAPGRNPPKAEIIQLLDQMRETSANPAVVRQTKAALDLVTPVSESYGGMVLNDPDPAKNGYYSRASAAWVKGRGFPDTLAVLGSVGGTGNAITATAASAVHPADVAMFVLVPVAANTGAVTLSIGEGVKALLDVSGQPMGAGLLAAGRAVLIFRLGDDYRLASDPDADAAAEAAAASAGAANTSAERAEAARDAAIGAVPSVHTATYATMAQLDPVDSEYVFVLRPPQSGLFAWDGNDRSADVDGGTVIPPGAGNSAGLATDGSDGAWVRVYGELAQAEWFATDGDGSSGDPFTGFEVAANAILADGGSLRFGPYDFEFAEPLEPTSSGSSIYGCGKEITRLLAGASLADPLVNIATGINSVSFLGGMTLVGTGKEDGKTGIYLGGNSSRHTLIGVNVQDFGTAVLGNYSWVNTFINCNFSAADYGVFHETQCNSWTFLGGAITHCAIAALQTDHSEGGVLQSVNIAENAMYGVALGAFSRAWTVGPGNYFENNRYCDVDCSGSSSNYVERNQGIVITGNHFAGVKGDYSLPGGVTPLTADEAKLLANIKVQATEGIVIEGNNHRAAFLDARQLAHILFYDPYAPDGKIEKAKLAGNANAIAYRSKFYANNSSFPGTRLPTDYSSEAIGAAGFIGETQVSSFATGQSLVSDTVLDTASVYECVVHAGTSANVGDGEIYLCIRTGTGDICKSLSGGLTGVTVSITAGDQVRVENTSGSNMTLRMSLTRRS